MKKRILKQRLMLGLILLCGAALFTWAVSRLTPEPLWLFDDPVTIPDIHVPIPDVIPTVLGIDDITFANPPKIPMPPPNTSITFSPEYVQALTNFNYLTHRIFLVDPETILFPSDINVLEFLEADLTIDTSMDGPQVLIFHTHSTEMFTDSNPAYPMTGIMGVGAYLAKVLEENYGIRTYHHIERFDMMDGRSRIQGAYERMEPVIRQILADNPSIQVVIDLHRDGVGNHVPAFVRYVNDKPTAQIMFFNGLSRQNRNGQAVTIYRLPNPYQRENLNFSFRLQLAANQLYPGLARRVYLRAFRYSLHMAPLSTLVEVGNQHNTQQQAKNAMYPLAHIIAAVVLGS